MKIKTHKLNREYTGQYFFILSKGNNAGKPLVQPCPNCFVLLADDAKQREDLYWLCFGLWQGGFFLPFLCGSVIPFIHLADLRKVITSAGEKIGQKPESFAQAVQLLNSLTAHEERIKEQMKLIKDAKRAVMHKLLK